MAFCKVCTCGEKIVFDRPLSYPEKCPSCGRRLVDFMTYVEDDPRVEELLKNTSGTTEEEKDKKPVFGETSSVKKQYYLKLINGSMIPIPDEGCIIGRTETGAEELAEFPSVSRQHLRVTPRRNIGVLVEDISTYGTLVDGQRIVKNTPVRVVDGSKITLCDLETVLMAKEGND